MREQQNYNELIRVFAVNSSGVGVTAATIVLSIRRRSDGAYWSGTLFAPGYATVGMTAIDATNLPGQYSYAFNTSGLADDEYLLTATTVTASIANAPWHGYLKIGGWVDNVDAQISAIKDQVVEAEGSYTIKQALSVILSAVAGRTTDSGATFKTANNNATRIAATVNASNERTAITLTPSS